MIDVYARIEQAVVSHFHAVAYTNMWIDLGIFAYFYIFAYYHERTNVGMRTNLGSRGNGSQAADAFLAGLALLVDGEQLGQRFVGIVYFDQRGLYFLFRNEVFIH